MLIKLQEGANSLRYLVVENVKNVRYEIQTRYFANENEMAESEIREQTRAKSLRVDRMEVWYYRTNGLPAPAPQTSGFSLNLLRFEKDSVEYLVWFDGEAFICNDEGKTIQVVKSTQ